MADWSRFMARSPPFPRKFFKPLTPGFQNGMAIPIAFTRSLGEKKLDKALIKSCQGSWDVQVRRTCDGVFCFKQGWKEVVKNHSLEVGEFLVFEHKGNMVFNVKVYEPLGCEKKFPPPSFRLIMAKTHWNVKCPSATIPLDFARSTGILDKSCMHVKDPFGKLWPMDIGIVKDKEKIEAAWSRRTYLKSKGWIEFYKANKLKDADVCIFELIQVPKSRSKPVIMNVKIFRFGS
ncbi:hypothetical protein C1H46_037518 [Malus baccata]|uniref:TF-B3 domain-containing protein n=1 Tax=Malus baccata TaxID=106549 RepID=A0A540KSF5_MALBA|nr:hypothetical protein C1H46_037518 [Malus baccata]